MSFVHLQADTCRQDTHMLKAPCVCCDIPVLGGVPYLCSAGAPVDRVNLEREVQMKALSFLSLMDVENTLLSE